MNVRMFERMLVLSVWVCVCNVYVCTWNKFKFSILTRETKEEDKRYTS